MKARFKRDLGLSEVVVRPLPRIQDLPAVDPDSNAIRARYIERVGVCLRRVEPPRPADGETILRNPTAWRTPTPAELNVLVDPLKYVVLQLCVAIVVSHES